ncbi:response regulator [Paraburkholderia sp. LEh10]|uniref:response regulator n=1 Tax=Paraburkholderia sp. LEh10 TaxID=2821353 RepID=UPI001AE5ECAA|nr:response regulator [Paraburkholderia sp. LEh10]MBP0595944.1 response regulator [Paraburkholderia sp. LEh10]
MSTILLVDDDLDNLWPLQLTLEGRGHHVLLAENGQAAMEKLVREPVQLVVTDWQMPQMDGIELCRRIRSRPSTADVPVILLSAAPEPPGDRRGWFCFFRKPVDPGVLLERIDMFVAQRLASSLRNARADCAEPACRWAALNARCWP